MASNCFWHKLTISNSAPASAKLQHPACIWFTGLSGSGKSTIANLLDNRLYAEGRLSYLLDGDNLRQGLNRDLGFSNVDRNENIRRVSEVARLMVDAGLIAIVSFISPFRDHRVLARSLFLHNQFYEVFVDTPLEECIRRDPKGLYAKACQGQLPHFTGLDSPYDPPVSPEIHLKTLQDSPEACVEIIMKTLTCGSLKKVDTKLM